MLTIGPSVLGDRLGPQLSGLRFGAATSDRVRLAAAAAQDDQHIFTTVAWVLNLTRTNTRRIWTKGSGDDKTLYLTGTAGAVEFIVACATTFMFCTSAAGALPLNAPAFLACTYSSVDKIGRLYIGGLKRPATLDTTGSAGVGAENADNTQPWTIGNAGAASPTLAFPGVVYLFAHYNRVLSLDEIQEMQFEPKYLPGCRVLLNLGERGFGRRVLNYGADFNNGTITGAKGRAMDLPIPFGITPRRRYGKAGAAGTPVSQTLETPYEALALAAQTQLTPWEALALASQSGLASWESLALAQQSGQAPWESLTGIATEQLTPYEALARAAQELLTAWESAGTITQQQLTPWESGGTATQALLAAWESLRTEAQAQSAAWESLTTALAQLATAFEALGRIEREQATPWESAGTIAQQSSPPWESLAGLTTSQLTAYEALRGEITQSLATMWESLVSVLAQQPSAWESLGKEFVPPFLATLRTVAVFDAALNMMPVLEGEVQSAPAYDAELANEPVLEGDVRAKPVLDGGAS